jgi:hypothetical protein
VSSADAKANGLRHSQAAQVRPGPRRASRQRWDAAHIDVRREMQGELCDLFNYADLLGDEVMKVRIQLWCRDIWQELEDMGD